MRGNIPVSIQRVLSILRDPTKVGQKMTIRRVAAQAHRGQGITSPNPIPDREAVGCADSEFLGSGNAGGDRQGVLGDGLP